MATRSQEIVRLYATIARGQWQWVLVALALQAAYYVDYTALYQATFAAVGVATKLRDLLPVMVSSVFVNTVTPSLGAGGAALFVDAVARRGQSGARAAAGAVPVPIADMTTVNLLLLVSIAYLYSVGRLLASVLVSAGVLLLANAGLAALLAMALYWTGALRRALVGAEEAANALARLTRRRPLALFFSFPSTSP